MLLFLVLTFWGGSQIVEELVDLCPQYALLNLLLQVCQTSPSYRPCDDEMQPNPPE